MSMLQMVRDKLKTAMKSKAEREKDMLRLVIGRTDNLRADLGCEPNDEQVASVIRKIIKGNNEVMKFGSEEQQQKMRTENEYLGKLLPQTLSVEEIVVHLQPIVDDLRAKQSPDGATGVAVKYLKQSGVKALGGDVSMAVKQILGVEHI